MKKPFLLLGVLLTFIPSTVPAAQTAQARAYCMSLRFFQSFDSDNEDLRNYSLNLSSLTNRNNGELQPFHYFFNSNTTHSAYLDMQIQWPPFFEHYYGGLDLTVPDGGDANGNGYPDFFEVSQPTSGTSSGRYSVANVGNSNVSASWSRAAGTRYGTCTLIFSNTVFGDSKFIATFELIEYTGPLTYTPGSNTVAGSVNLVQTDNTNSTLRGPLTFVKTTTNRFNTLVLQPSGWTNASAQTLTYTNSTLYRNQSLQTNYYGYLMFDDGDPNTSEADYYIWELSIDDLNDADHDGIPDFSDDPSSTQPRRPVLTLTRGATNLFLKISGDVGRTNLVQELTSLTLTNWNTISSFMVTNDPQTVSLPLPASPRYWRVQVK